MKYGQIFQAQSVPQWAPYNVDYNELKNLIKVNTIKDQGQAIAIPGQPDTARQKFEQIFFDELVNQHDRVDLFVKSKADEISRRLSHFQVLTHRLIARSVRVNGKPISLKRQAKFSKYNGLITRCGDDIFALKKFINAQAVAFRKILKKYKKWTGSSTLGERFNNQVLSSPKSFTRKSLEPLSGQYKELLATLSNATPTALSGASTPLPETAPSDQPQSQRRERSAGTLRQAYWNEYDNGSEAGDGDEPYYISCDPDSEISFPGIKTVTQFFGRARGSMEKVKGWLSPPQTPVLGRERRPLLTSDSYFARNASLTDVDGSRASSSSSDYPPGYIPHYSTFPSVADQRALRSRESLLFNGMLTSFFAAIILLVIAGILVTTGRHKLRLEVDTGALVGVVTSLLFAALGFVSMLYRKDFLSWLHRGLVSVIFVVICGLNGAVLVAIAGV